MKDPFEILGVRRDAPMEEIDKAYKRLVAKYHPDRYRDNPLRELAEEKLKEINEAYETVKLIRSGYYTSDSKTAGSQYQANQQPSSAQEQNYYRVAQDRAVNQPYGQPYNQPNAPQQSVEGTTSDGSDDFCAGCLTGLAICYCLEACSECGGSC